MKVVKVTLQAAGKGPRLSGNQTTLLSLENTIDAVRSMGGFTKKYMKQAEVADKMLREILLDMEEDAQGEEED